MLPGIDTSAPACLGRLPPPRRQIQEKLIKFATRVPIFMYLTDFRERCLKDIGGYDTAISAKEYLDTFVNRPVMAK